MSINADLIRLMNEEIDGVISDGDAARLSAALSESPEVAKYYAELRETLKAVDEAGGIDPPPELRERIFRSVYGRREEAAAAGTDGSRRFWRSFLPVFAAGAAAGFILFAVISPMTDRGNDEYGGTMGVSRDSGDLRTFDAHGVSGSVLPVLESGSITMTVRIKSPGEASMLVDLGEGVSFESIRSTEGAAYQMEVEENSLLLVQEGEAEYVIRFRSADMAAVELRIFSGGKTVASMAFTGGG